MSFNTSTKKDDVSFKLRTHNMRNTKQQTRQLEAESRRMEERLQELKLAMNREKEQRETQGGNFWRSGQEGNLGTYAQDVLHKTTKKSASSNRDKSSKRRGVKVLKDEPIVVPERTKGPGTIGNIAQRNLDPTKSKIKGPKCGQCEQKAAHVNCLECCEDYCAGCFAGFHLKGALKKHRSQPIGSNGFRKALSPRPPPSVRSNTNSTENTAQSRTDPERQAASSMVVTERSDPVGSSVSHEVNGSTLLSGQYDEEESAAAFQAALQAWRTGGTDAVLAMEEKKENSGTHITKSPRKEKSESTEMGTSTQEERTKPININFSRSGLTYAERLMLKKHRRGDQGMLAEVNVRPDDSQTIRVDENHVDFTQVMEMVTPRGGQPSSLEGALWSHGNKEPSFVLKTHRETSVDDTRSDSRVSIIEMDNVPLRLTRGMEQSSSYYVTEGPEGIPHPSKRSPSPHIQEAREAFATPPVSARSGRGSGKRRNSSSRQQSQENQILGKENDPKKVFLTKEPITLAMNVLLKNKAEDAEKNNNEMEKVDSKRPKSVTKQRPLSRGTNASKKRPPSRTSSRAKSRASSRTSMYGEGLLTKGPSEALKEVARITGSVDQTPQYTGGLTEFFTAGVKPSPQQEERVLTPSGSRNQTDQKWKVSYKLYAMAPRSWRPESSLGGTVDSNQVEGYLEDPGVQDLQETALESAREPEQTLRWSLSSGKVQVRERSTLERERSSMREQAYQQKEDIFPEEPIQRSLSRLSSRTVTPRVATPRIGTPTPRLRTPRPDSGRPSSIGRSSLRMTTQATSSRPGSVSGRESQAIVMDGKDLSDYDDLGVRDEQDEADQEALGKLEWELASQDGRITGDGKISRMSLIDPDLLEEGDLDIAEDDGPGSGLSSPEPENEGLDYQLRESVLMEDFEEMEDRLMQEEEVKALN